ncbi:MAG: flagellar filament capping protein FliD [Sphingobium sp.]|nr:flagellar filament capping protein FliD [Sphingobium sp.]
MVDVASSLTSALGMSSGINTAQLVADLTAASFSPKIDNLSNLMSTNSARISALASAKSSLQTFSDALTKLLDSTAYSGQPVSNDPSIVAVTPTGSGKPMGLPAQIEVQQLASAQVLQSTALPNGTALAGTGTLTLTVGTKSYDITLTTPATSLADLASAINNAKSGVTASIVTDQSGARLVLKGDTGVGNAFTLTAKTTGLTTDQAAPDTDLSRFTWDGTTGGMTRSQEAQNAKIKIDNVAMEFDKNDITTAIPNLRVDLNRAAPGTNVTIATDQPTSTMSDLVQQIVDAYNTLKGALNTATRTTDGQGSSSGLLASDAGIRDMSNRLARLTSTELTPDGDYKTLADLGVTTNRDGTLALDQTKLKKALAANPEAVVEMLNPTAKDATHTGIAGALSAIKDYLTGDKGPLTSSQAIYDKLTTSYQKQMDILNDQKTTYSDRLTTTYAAMQGKLLQFKATQSYLEQQIEMWKNQR